MKPLDGELVLWGVMGAAIVGAILYFKGHAADIGAAIPKAANDLAGGIGNGLGDLVGLPRTDEIKFQKDVAAGDWWAASVDGTAGQFLGALKNRLFGSNATPTAPVASDNPLDFGS